MDKKFLTEHNLLEAQKRFQMIVEYSSLGEPVVDEAGEPDPNAAPGGDPSMGGGIPGDDPSMGGGDPSMGGGPTMGGGAPGTDPSMGGDMSGADPSMGGGDPSQGVPEFQPQEAPATEAPQGEDAGEDDEIIDVDELTDAQEDTKDKVKEVDRKLEKFIDLVDKLADDIDKNNEHIEQLRKDFEKRNPTQVEKMTLRAKKGYPFAESPDDYWDAKEQEGEYSPESDNNGVGDQRYQITKNDVDNITDWADIYKSIDDGSFHHSLKDILNF